MAMNESLRELKDFVRDNFDSNLMTFKEHSMLINDCLKLDRLIVKRAEELGFNPFFLSEIEKYATALCIPSEDVKFLKRSLEIMRKNQHLKKALSKQDKLIVENYAIFTIIFSNLDSIKSEKEKQKINELLTDEVVGLVAFLYSWVMKKHNERLFESPFDFLPKERQNAVVDAGFLWLAKRGFIAKRGGEDS